MSCYTDQDFIDWKRDNPELVEELDKSDYWDKEYKDCKEDSEYPNESKIVIKELSRMFKPATCIAKINNRRLLFTRRFNRR